MAASAERVTTETLAQSRTVTNQARGAKEALLRALASEAPALAVLAAVSAMTVMSKPRAVAVPACCSTPAPARCS